MINHQEQGYRKGQLLGFTMAEMVILIIMVLLLGLSALLTKAKAERDEARAAVEKSVDSRAFLTKIYDLPSSLSEDWTAITDRANAAQVELTGLREEVSRLRLEHTDPAALSKQLAAAQEKIRELENRLAIAGDSKLVEKAALCDAIVAAHGTPPEDPAKFVQAAQVGESVINSVGPISPAAAAELSKAAPALANCKGQVSNLRRQIGPGGNLPPCWVDQNGNIEYAFDVILTDGGLTVKDTRPDYRRKEVEASISFNRLLSREEFLRQTRSYLDYSKQQDPECRFYVRQVDRTGRDKQTFNRLRYTVEQIFYKLETR